MESDTVLCKLLAVGGTRRTDVADKTGKALLSAKMPVKSSQVAQRLLKYSADTSQVLFRALVSRDADKYAFLLMAREWADVVAVVGKLLGVRDVRIVFWSYNVGHCE